MEGHSSKSRLESNTSGNAPSLSGSVKVELRTLAEYGRYALKLWDTCRSGIPYREMRLSAKKWYRYTARKIAWEGFP